MGRCYLFGLGRRIVSYLAPDGGCVHYDRRWADATLSLQSKSIERRVRTAFGFYAGTNVLALIMIFLFMPETKQRTLEVTSNYSYNSDLVSKHHPRIGTWLRIRCPDAPACALSGHEIHTVLVQTLDLVSKGCQARAAVWLQAGSIDNCVRERCWPLMRTSN